MIRRIQNEKQLLPWAEDPVGLRACAAATAYGIDGHVCQFWLQNEDTLLCRMDDSMVLCAGPNVDWEELEGFLPLTGARVLLCREEEAKRLGLPVLISGWVMLRQGGEDTAASFCEVEENPSLRELHALLTECETDTFHAPEFEAFYLDVSHRTRHGEAVSVGLRRGGKLVAAAFCTAKSNALAILSGVAVLPQLQGQGLGATVVRALQNRLCQPKQCVYRAQGEHKSFYEMLGFRDAFPFAELSLE